MELPFRPSLRRWAEQAAIPLALLLLLVLVAGLTFQVHARDRSHQELAGQAVRDYASFAAWEFSRHASTAVRNAAESSVRRAYQHRPAAGAPLPAAALLGPDGQCRCDWDRASRVAFRYTLADGELTTHVPAEPALRKAIERHRLDFRESVTSGVGRRPSDDEDAAPTPPWAQVRIDTVAGAPMVLAYTVMRDRHERALAVYGVVAEPELITRSFGCTVDDQPLLPPSLTRGAPNDSVLHLRVEYPAGGVILSRGSSNGGLYAAKDTMRAALGGLVTVVELRPELASSLVIGGVPSSRLPQLLVLLAVAVALSGLGLAQLRRARELSRLRSQFVANVSHELRTPLAQISMFSETLLLARERSPEERQQFLSVIFREARRLTTLVEGVLRFSRGEAGVTRLRPEPRELVSDIRETLASFRPLAAAGRVTLCERMPEEAWAMADGGAVRQILLNLLDNGVKYGPRGQTVTVCVERAREASGGEVIRVAVNDEGPGIPVEQRATAFEPFARLELAGTGRVPGAGIGLSVVLELVHAQGGRVWIDDAVPYGTSVRFTLPVAEPVRSTATVTDELPEFLVDREPASAGGMLEGAAR